MISRPFAMIFVRYIRQAIIEGPRLHDPGGPVMGLIYVTAESSEWSPSNAANTLSGNNGMDCTCTPMAS